jgi:hypothetical protein
MKRTIKALIALGACFLAPALVSFVSAARAQSIDWQTVDEALGRKPAVSDDVHRYGFPVPIYP